MLETVIAMLILVVGINITLSYKTTLYDIREKSLENVYPIIAYGGNQEELPITEEDYLYCKKNFSKEGNVEFVYMIGEPNGYYDEEHNIGNFYYLYVSEGFFPYYLGTQGYKEDIIYVGSLVRIWLNKDKVAPLGTPRSLDFLNRQEVRDIEELNTLVKDYSPYGFMEEKIQIENCVILPLSLYDGMIQPTTSVQLLLKTDIANLEEVSDYVIEYLDNKSVDEPNATQYTLNSEVERYIQMNQLIVEKYEIANTYIIVALFIILFGLTGVLMLLVLRRKKAYAISLMLGASISRLINELFVEVLFAVMASTGVGILFGSWLLNFEVSDTFVISFYPITLVICSGIALLVSILGCIIPYMMMYRLSPIQVLGYSD